MKDLANVLYILAGFILGCSTGWIGDIWRALRERCMERPK